MISNQVLQVGRSAQNNNITTQTRTEMVRRERSSRPPSQDAQVAHNVDRPVINQTLHPSTRNPPDDFQRAEGSPRTENPPRQSRRAKVNDDDGTLRSSTREVARATTDRIRTERQARTNLSSQIDDIVAMPQEFEEINTEFQQIRQRLADLESRLRSNRRRLHSTTNVPHRRSQPPVVGSPSMSTLATNPGASSNPEPTQPDAECSICSELLSDETRLTRCRWQCGQQFHGECIDGWLARLLAEEREWSCPYGYATTPLT